MVKQTAQTDFGEVEIRISAQGNVTVSGAQTVDVVIPIMSRDKQPALVPSTVEESMALVTRVKITPVGVITKFLTRIVGGIRDCGRCPELLAQIGLVEEVNPPFDNLVDPRGINVYIQTDKGNQPMGKLGFPVGSLDPRELPQA
ncbi:MAG TPA: hypothetical protein VJK50_04890 [Patescibacteria group bacterium]|nr:hypothetical protein [Patescibacteria group bacterium]